MLEAINVDRESMMPWLPWVATDNRNVAECTYVVERCRREREKAGADDFTMGILDHAGTPIGGTGLHRIHPEWSQAEIGYWVRADRRSQGLCTEAVAHLISAAVMPQERGGWGLRRIEIKCAGANVASQRVPRKLGLREESRLSGQRWTEGVGWDDTLTWGVVAEEWDCAGHRLR